MGCASTGSRASLAVLLVGLLATGGCSFVLVSGPPSRAKAEELAARQETPQCTATKGVPTLDIVLSLALSLGTLNAVSNYDSHADPNDGYNKLDLQIFGAAAIALSAASAIYGFVQVNRCNKYMSSRPLAPPAGAPAFQPPAVMGTSE